MGILDVCTCAPFEEGILHLWMGGWAGLGMKRAGSNKLQEVGNLLGYLIARVPSRLCVPKEAKSTLSPTKLEAMAACA